MKSFFSISKVLVPVLVAGFFLHFGGMWGCGGSSSSSSSDSGGGSGTGTSSGEASTASLATVPSVDISNLDVSQSSSSSSSLTAGLVVNESKETSADDKKKGLAQEKAVGDSSRAGCETNAHKNEMVRNSQQVQLDRCYAEAMETAGLITIPTGSFALYSITPPSEAKDNQGKACDGIPADHTDEVAACKSGGEGPGAEGMLVRIGRFDKDLRVDLCQGKEGSAALTSESTYGANGSIYTISAIHKDTWGGHAESNKFDATVDLGTTGKVTDGIVSLGDGTATANASMDGGFGNGTLHFEALGADSSNIVSGVFAASFTDPRAKVKNTFTGKTYSHFSATSGCSKFSFTGSPPPMPASQMIPFDIPDTQLSSFLQSFGQQLGITLTKDNYKTIFFCPNPDFNPDSPSTTIPPMLAATAGQSCPSQTHTGVECYTITNGSTNGNFGEKKISQSYTILENAKSSYFTEVDKFDLGTLSNTASTIAFSRNWDCTGTFSPIAFGSLTEAQATKAEAGMKKCFALEEKARGNEGMGGHDCDQKEQQRGVDKFAQNGPPPPGKFDGACALKTAGNTCKSGATRPTYFFNTCGTKECFQAPGAAQEFTVTGTSSGAVKLYDSTGNFCVTQIDFTQPGGDTTKPASSAHLAIKTGVTDSTCSGGTACVQDCDMTVSATFDKPPEGQGGGTPPPSGQQAGTQQPGQQGFVPKACTDRGLTGNACRDLCHSPDVNCRE